MKKIVCIVSQLIYLNRFKSHKSARRAKEIKIFQNMHVFRSMAQNIIIIIALRTQRLCLFYVVHFILAF